jgi:hypothetical protein
VQIPVITKFSQKKATYAGLGNIQLSYIYLVDDPRYTFHPGDACAAD